jgi:RNA polymerase sigma-70 factor (ECF subfamily)
MTAIPRALLVTRRLSFGISIAHRGGMHDISELELSEQSRSGNVSALAELFRRYYPTSVRMALGILRSHDDSLDAVQSAYLSAYQHFSSFRQDASFKTWISRIVINKCLGYFRQPARRLRWVWLDDVESSDPPVLLPGHMPSPEDAASTREIAAALAQAIQKLPQPMRQVVQLCTIGGLSTAAAADALGLSIPATKTRLFRARAKMQAHLQGFRRPQQQRTDTAVANSRM